MTRGSKRRYAANPQEVRLGVRKVLDDPSNPEGHLQLADYLEENGSPLHDIIRRALAAGPVNPSGSLIRDAGHGYFDSETTGVADHNVVSERKLGVHDGFRVFIRYPFKNKMGLGIAPVGHEQNGYQWTALYDVGSEDGKKQLQDTIRTLDAHDDAHQARVALSDYNYEQTRHNPEYADVLGSIFGKGHEQMSRHGYRHRYAEFPAGGAAGGGSVWVRVPMPTPVPARPAAPAAPQAPQQAQAAPQANDQDQQPMGGPPFMIMPHRGSGRARMQRGGKPRRYSAADGRDIIANAMQHERGHPSHAVLADWLRDQGSPLADVVQHSEGPSGESYAHSLFHEPQVVDGITVHAGYGRGGQFALTAGHDVKQLPHRPALWQGTALWTKNGTPHDIGRMVGHLADRPGGREFVEHMRTRAMEVMARDPEAPPDEGRRLGIWEDPEDHRRARRQGHRDWTAFHAGLESVAPEARKMGRQARPRRYAETPEQFSDALYDGWLNNNKAPFQIFADHLRETGKPYHAELMENGPPMMRDIGLLMHGGVESPRQVDVYHHPMDEPGLVQMTVKHQEGVKYPHWLWEHQYHKVPVHHAREYVAGLKAEGLGLTDRAEQFLKEGGEVNQQFGRRGDLRRYAEITERQLRAASVDPVIQGSRLAYHLKQLKQEFAPGHEIHDLAAAALSGQNASYERLGQALAEHGHRLGDRNTYNWKKMADGVALDRRLMAFAQKAFKPGQENVHQRAAQQFAGDHLIQTNKGRFSLNPEATRGDVGRFWSRVRDHVNASGTGRKYTDHDIIQSLRRLGQREADRGEFAGRQRKPEIDKGTHTERSWRNYLGMAPFKGTPEAYRRRGRMRRYAAAPGERGPLDGIVHRGGDLSGTRMTQHYPHAWVERTAVKGALEDMGADNSHRTVTGVVNKLAEFVRTRPNEIAVRDYLGVLSHLPARSPGEMEGKLPGLHPRFSHALRAAAGRLIDSHRNYHEAMAADRIARRQGVPNDIDIPPSESDYDLREMPETWLPEHGKEGGGFARNAEEIAAEALRDQPPAPPAPRPKPRKPRPRPEPPLPVAGPHGAPLEFADDFLQPAAIRKPVDETPLPVKSLPPQHGAQGRRFELLRSLEEEYASRGEPLTPDKALKELSQRFPKEKRNSLAQTIAAFNRRKRLSRLGHRTRQLATRYGRDRALRIALREVYGGGTTSTTRRF